MIDSSNLPPINPDMIRPELRAVRGDNPLNKPTLGQRFGSFLAKVGSFIGRVAAPILSVIGGPFGMIGSAAMYGLNRFSEGALARMQAKKAQEAELDAQTAQMSAANFPSGIPTQLSDPMSGPTPQLQWDPSVRGLEKNIESTLTNKGRASLGAVNQMTL